jgi:diguanylate cyclase (GGDEF)-like protein/PAS domain S-box-containing protein
MVSNFRNRALADSDRELKNTALILAEQVELSFQAIELVQSGVMTKVQSLGIASSEDLTRRMSGPDENIILKASISGVVQLDAIALLNADGKLFNYSHDWPVPDVNNADRDYFKALKSDTRLTSFISRPVLNRINGRWTVYLARKLTTPNGVFLGVILGAIDMSYFEKIFSSVVLNDESSITLFRADGVLLARYPHTESVIGKTFEAAINAVGANGNGTIRFAGQIARADRLLAAHKLAHYPLLVSVAVDTGAALADWQSETRILLSVGGLAALTVAVMILLIARQLSLSHKLDEENLRRTKIFLDTVIENVPLPIMVKTSKESRFVLINKAGEDLLGFRREEIIGKTPHEALNKEWADIIVTGDRKSLHSDQPILLRDHTIPTPRGDRIVSSKKVLIPADDGKPEFLLTVIDDVTERKQTEQRIAHMAHHDALTGLFNRAKLIEKLEAALTVVALQGGDLAVHFIDLDHFKDVNDTFGHDGGDFLLETVAERLRAVIRIEDVAARLGGDEFIVVQSGISGKDQAEDFACRLVSALTAPMMFNEQDILTTISVGVALAPADGTNPERLLKSADLAVYKAKADGRNCIRFFEPEMDADLLARLELERMIRNGVLNDGFQLVYQPLFEISGRRLIGFEALIRLPKADGTLIPPMEFIPIAEDMRLIDKIGAWVLREACRTAATWPEHLTIAVNLSPTQFAAGNVSALVASALKDTGLASHRLELEITETLLLGNTEAILMELNTLKAIGVAIVMDDFGTGYSSLSYLWRFPVDKIKIDRSFVEGFDGFGRNAATVVKTIIALGRELNMRVVVEGVETAEQVAFLEAADGDQVQGFYFGRPIPASEIAATILSAFQQQGPASLKPSHTVLIKSQAT